MIDAIKGTGEYMLRSNKSGVLLSAVVAALPIFGWVTSARAQYQTGNGGHALDASNRVGSGGINQQGTNGSTSGYSNSNNVFTGNVTGLDYFHGNTNGIFNPNTIQANTESAASDLINRTSAPANGQSQQQGGGTYQDFYSSTRVAAPLANYAPTLNGQAFVPKQPTNPLTADPDVRLGTVNVNNTGQNLLASPGEIDMAGQVDPSGGQSLYTMSPIYGVRKNDSSNAADTFFVSQYSSYGQSSSADRAHLDAASVRKMQDELNNSALPADQQAPNSTNPNGAGTTPQVAPGAISPGQLPGATLAPSQLSAQALSSSVRGSQLSTGLDSGQGTQNRLLVPAAQQSAQIQALEKKYAGQRLTDAQASDLYNQQQRLLQQQTADVPAKGTVATAKPGAAGAPGLIAPSTFGDKLNPGAAAAPDTNLAAAKPAPKLSPILAGTNPKPDATPDNQSVVITSLATGIKARGLAALLKTAEDQMHSGKFSEAIASYDTAEEVAPNNPFVPLGRGFAELGRSYYVKADIDITRAVSADPAVLAGQYDLKGFIGDDRVRFIQKDLQDIASAEKTARASVLLAYIAHNTGDDITAAKQLDDASSRGGYTGLISLMRQTWGLKAAGVVGK